MITTVRRHRPPRLRSRCPALLAVTVACLIAGCTGDDRDTEVRQTEFPGQVSTGGRTSGELLDRRSRQGGSDGAEGTPGIPGGSGGNTGGTRMGSAGGEGNGNGGKHPKGGADEAAKKKQDEARAKQQLAAAMDRVAAHWRERAANAPSLGIDGPPIGVKQGLADDVPRSQKHGTAPPSEDVKRPTPDGPAATVPNDAYRKAQ